MQPRSSSLTHRATQEYQCKINIRGYWVNAQCWEINQDGYTYAVKVQSSNLPDELKAEIGLTAMIPQTISYIREKEVGTKLDVGEPI